MAKNTRKKKVAKRTPNTNRSRQGATAAQTKENANASQMRVVNPDLDDVELNMEDIDDVDEETMDEPIQVRPTPKRSSTGRTRKKLQKRLEKEKQQQDQKLAAKQKIKQRDPKWKHYDKGLDPADGIQAWTKQ